METLKLFDGIRDPVSSLTHLFTAVIAVYVLLLLSRLTRREPRKRRSLFVFGLSMFVLYLASGVYHAIPGHYDDAHIAIYRRIDISAIFLLIAGSYTPMIAVFLPKRQREFMLALMWGLAAAGILTKWLLPAVPHPITIGQFISLGIVGFLPWRAYAHAVGYRGLLWAVCGALCYVVGAVIDLADAPNPVPGVINAHELTHFCDMAGTGVHIAFILRYIVPFQTAHAARRVRRMNPAAVPALVSHD